MIHLESIAGDPARAESLRGFPFSVPVVRSLREMAFPTPVTLFVGENGSGKSTILEAIACATHAVAAGSQNPETDETLRAVREFARWLRLRWRKKTRKGFYLRAEDFFGYARRLAQMRAELESGLRAVDDEYAGRSEAAKGLAKMPYARELSDLSRRYGTDGLDAHSHGESFLTFFQSRFVPGGLYLLDEPEAPLSPMRQLAFVAMLKQMVDRDSQFVVATHSPILMAFPGATVLSFDSVPPRAVPFEDLEQVALMRDFLNSPEAYLRHL